MVVNLTNQVCFTLPTIVWSEWPAIVSAIATAALVFVGWFQLRALRRENSRRATLEFVSQETSSPEWLKIRQEYLKYIRENSSEKHGLSDDVFVASYESINGAVYAVLNRHEMLALMISCGAIDEDMMRRMWSTATVKDWKALAPIVEYLRVQDNNDQLFVEFEKLAKRWDSNSNSRDRK